MPESVRRHYERYPYPHYPLIASVCKSSTYALNLSALWTRFNGELPPDRAQKVLIAGCGSFAPYPFALANPGVRITALDLSEKSLSRARRHCLVHGLRNVDFVAGDLMDEEVAPGPYGMIDAYGVIHHLEDPLAGLRRLAARLCDGGIIRVMVYSRYARSDEESIRRALRLLKVTEPEQVLAMVTRSRPGSRLRRFFDSSDEVAHRSGLADALLHPCVTTFRIDPFIDLVAASGLSPLLFAHRGALPDLGQELSRLRSLERERRSPGNFVAYLGKSVRGEAPEEASFLLNPVLHKAVGGLKVGEVPVPGRLGHDNPPLDREARRFLRRFRRPVPSASLSGEELGRAQAFADELFLMRYREGTP